MDSFDRCGADARSVRPGGCGDHSNHDGESRDLAGGDFGNGRRHHRIDQQGCVRPYCHRAKRRLRRNNAAEQNDDAGFEEGRYRRLLLPLPSEHESDPRSRANTERDPISLPSTIMNVQLEAPVRFSPSVERPDADEAKTTQALIATMRYINEKTFADGGHALRSVPDKAQWFKKILSAAMRQVQKAIVVVTGHPNTTVATLGGQPETHILGETFYSQAPLRFDDFIAKISVAPKSPELKALAQASLNVNGVPNGLREAVLDFFGKNGGVWEVRAQLCTDLEHMPIENAAVVWSEEVSPYQRIARITVKPQLAWSEVRSSVVDDGMSFTPWHGLAAHRPLGGIMRVRKAAYEAAKKFRAERNGRIIQEPREMVPFGD